MARFGKLTALIGVAEAARRYARSNPDKAGKYLDQAAQFVDKQTKGKYTNQISSTARKAKDAAGIPQPGHGYGAPGTTQQPPYPQQPTQPTPPRPAAGDPSAPGNGSGNYGSTEGYQPPQPGQQYEPPRY